MKIGLFADVQNIYYTTRQIYGQSFNYRALWATVAAEGLITVANAYAIDRGDGEQIKFQNALHHIGFMVKLKPFIQRVDDSAKGDWDVGIAIDVMVRARGDCFCCVLLFRWRYMCAPSGGRVVFDESGWLVVVVV